MASHYRQAWFNDPEVARELVKHDPPPGPSRPSLAEFDPVVSSLFNVCDLLMVAVSRLESLGGGKPSAVRPLLRPVTTTDHMRDWQANQQHLSLVAEVREAQARWAAAHSRAEG